MPVLKRQHSRLPPQGRKEARMSDTRTLLALALTAAILPLGCSDGDPVGVERDVPPGAVAASIHAVPDVSGTWNWSNEERLRMPPFVAGLVGIVPEGPNTHARCESLGSMTLSQSGDTFDGNATKSFNSCVTKGGQLFQQPGAVFQIEGRIAGMTMDFSFSTPTVAPCPHHAVISANENGVAVALSGTGHCILPGHPQSESSLAQDPPPGGTSKTISWEAVRP